MSALARLAAGARAPVFPLIGDAGRGRARRLLLDPRLRVVPSPRQATVLLVLGRLPEELHDAARRLHDQLPAPRATAVFVEGGPWRGPFVDPELLHDGAAIGDAIVALHRGLMTGERPCEPTLGAEDNPVQWRGLGPHGQGGEGMMGGKPYGRSMAMTGEDVRDGLSLDRLAVPLGPFLPWLPPGVAVDAVLQGDVVQELDLRGYAIGDRDADDPFLRARTEEVSVVELEVARARHHLEATADLLALHHLDALAVRTLRLASTLTPGDEGRVRRLARTLRWTGALHLATRGVGALDGAELAGTGPLERAAGVAEDARSEDPAYGDLGFEPVTHRAGDAEARWQQRLAEAAQSLSLARRVGDRRRAPGPVLEGPRGPVGESTGRAAWTQLERVAVGQAFDAFVTTLVSLDLDPAALRSDGEEA